jgi:hypothetical protein
VEGASISVITPYAVAALIVWSAGAHGVAILVTRLLRVVSFRVVYCGVLIAVTVVGALNIGRRAVGVRVPDHMVWWLVLSLSAGLLVEYIDRRIIVAHALTAVRSKRGSALPVRLLGLESRPVQSIDLLIGVFEEGAQRGVLPAVAAFVAPAGFMVGLVASVPMSALGHSERGSIQVIAKVPLFLAAAVAFLGSTSVIPSLLIHLIFNIRRKMRC